MSDRPDALPDEQPDERPASVSNPFADDHTDNDQQPQLNLSKRRAAMLGTGFGLVMVGLLLVCFLVSVALSSCAG
ncbi:MAG TPA: hypothetical protein VHG52_13990 [Thermomicrobiales bacterium]|nr:hypothetical protein [Thermomicrobiales bacterium]